MLSSFVKDEFFWKSIAEYTELPPTGLREIGKWQFRFGEQPLSTCLSRFSEKICEIFAVWEDYMSK